MLKIKHQLIKNMKSQYSLKNHVLDLWKILNISEKKNYILLLLMMIISVFIEALSLGSIYPLLLLFFDKEKFIKLIEKILNIFEFEFINNLTTNYQQYQFLFAYYF